MLFYKKFLCVQKLAGGDEARSVLLDVARWTPQEKDDRDIDLDGGDEGGTVPARCPHGGVDPPSPLRSRAPQD